MEKKEIMKKICLLGDSGVGKTSLIRRYVYDIFHDMYIMTFGAKVTRKDIRLYTDREEIVLTLGIWDIVGEHSRRNLQAEHYKGSSGALIVCDCTKRESLEHLTDWSEAFLRVAPQVKLVFLLNKIDLKERAVVKTDDLIEICEKHKAKSFETSAKTGENVEKAFKNLAEEMVFNR